MINFSVKKFIVFSLLIGISVNSNCLAEPKSDKIQNFLVTDDFVSKNQAPQEIQMQMINDFLITDDFVSKNQSPQNIQPQNINDFLITKDFVLKNSTPTLTTSITPKEIKIHDYFAEQSLKNCKPFVYKQKKYDFQNVNHLFVKVNSTKIISTKTPMNVGDEVFFVVSKDVNYNGKIIIKQGQIVSARVETISESGTYGVAADIILGNFKIGDLSLEGEIKKEGFTHTYWVIPVSQAAGFFIPFSNHLFRFVHGGHAKIKPKETFELQIPDEFWLKQEKI